MRTTVLIVDDHCAFCESASALLEAKGFEVVRGAEDGAGALAGLELFRPQVVLLDVQLPDLDGFVVAERLAAKPTDRTHPRGARGAPRGSLRRACAPD